MYTSIIALLAAFSTTSMALGINCRGSFYCNSDTGLIIGNRPAMLLDVVNYRVNLLGQDRARNTRFARGQQIACSVGACAGGDHCGTVGICAFFQGANYNNNYNLLDVQVALKKIVDHGCKDCGSQPLIANDVGIGGELTVNWVSKPCVQPPNGNLNTMC